MYILNYITLYRLELIKCMYILFYIQLYFINSNKKTFARKIISSFLYMVPYNTEYIYLYVIYVCILYVCDIYRLSIYIYIIISQCC